MVRSMFPLSSGLPVAYDRHVYFVDFRDFGRRNPIYYSMVREPVAKFESK